MNPTQILTDEHQLIINVLDLLEKARARLEAGEQVPSGFFETTMEFCSGFADRFHHFKEEFLLFGLLSYKKQGALDLAMGALRYQHGRCREGIAGISQALGGYKEKDGMSISFLLENLSVYVSLLKRHIHEEDTLFFPLAEKLLLSDEKLSLLHQFEAEDEQAGGRDAVFEKYRDMAKTLSGLLK